MNCGYNYNNYGCGGYNQGYACNPFGCGGCAGYNYGCGSPCGQGSNWFAIVLVVFLLLIICGCTRFNG